MDVFKLAQLAKAKGYAVAVKGGKVQFQTVVYGKGGKSTITRHTGFISVAEALDIINAK